MAPNVQGLKIIEVDVKSNRPRNQNISSTKSHAFTHNHPLVSFVRLYKYEALAPQKEWGKTHYELRSTSSRSGLDIFIHSHPVPISPLAADPNPARTPVELDLTPRYWTSSSNTNKSTWLRAIPPRAPSSLKQPTAHPHTTRYSHFRMRISTLTQCLYLFPQEINDSALRHCTRQNT
ncbi:hypothetical protein CC80DRAFT_107212 [Byssothecium circinans]|uniref:Uncharacterized protein n=1 Tax=Byssothecium circinans TaxID=147558 RepID=A0A6A5UGU7_9PLEO|nr:hypothetical protein CC80DRAFT_107212 [Byssothecium circinans]